MLRASLMLALFAPCAAAGVIRFTDASDTLPFTGTPVSSMDAAVSDIDGDGDLDVVIACEFAPNHILINDGEGGLSFAEKDLPKSNADSEDAWCADFDGDGDLDILFVSEDTHINELLLQQADGSFVPAPEPLPAFGTTNAVAVADLNGDGFLDILLGNTGQNRILTGRGGARFLEETPQRLPAVYDRTQDLELGDVDGDGDLDLVVANEGANRLLINVGDGVFTLSEGMLPAPDDQETREADLADIDGDGDLDLVLANVAWSGKDPSDAVLINDGSGTFTDETRDRLPSVRMFSLDADLADLDGDGDLDLVVVGVNSMVSRGGLRIFTNDGGGVFTDETNRILPLGYEGRSGIDVEIADFNGDGVLDLYLANHSSHDQLLLGARE